MQSARAEAVRVKGRKRSNKANAHSTEAAAQMDSAGCDAAVLYVGNFSPEIEDNEERF